MNFLFPYMARWKAINWTRYHQIFINLAKAGHNVHIIQAPASNSIESNYQEINVEIPVNLYIHDVDINAFFWNYNFPLNKLVKKGYYSFRSIKAVKKIIKKYEIDVLFLYNIPQYPLMNNKSCIKIFDFADDYIAMFQKELGPYSNPFFLKIGQYILDKMIKKSDITLAVSKVLAETIRYKNKVTVLPNGVDLNEINNNSGAKISEKYNKPVIGFIGSFEYFIDFDLILNVAQRLEKYTFLLVGTGRDFQKVQNKVKQKNLTNIVLTGGIPHYQIYEYIAAMDICLNIFKKIPISHGACPIKLFEYLSMKKPVISTRLDELKNIDEDFIFYADTTDELEIEINKILNNKNLVERRVEKGYNLVKTKYQWQQIVKDLVNIILNGYK